MKIDHAIFGQDQCRYRVILKLKHHRLHGYSTLKVKPGTTKTYFDADTPGMSGLYEYHQIERTLDRP